MKKYVMIGVNDNYCCELFSLRSFDNLISDEIEASDFIHDATDWGGQDSIDRTLKIIGMKQTGRKIILDNPIVFRGRDEDWGREYPWEFEVKEIHELE